MTVQVAGVGVVSPFGRGADALLAGLCVGRPAFQPFAPFVAGGLPHPLAAVVPEEALATSTPRDDRTARMLETVLRDALGDAGVSDLAGLARQMRTVPARVGLVVGTSSSGIGPFCTGTTTGAPRSDDRYGSAARDVAILLGHQGPLLVSCNVCASGAIAIAEAAALIAEGSCDVVLAAGCDALVPFVGAGFASLNALAPRATPFRAGRRGLILGEGAAALILAPHAERSRGSIRGCGMSADAHHLTAPDPSGAGVALAIRRALADADMPLEGVQVVNLHGTGTVFNDAMETAALTSVFGPRAGERPAYSVKGTIGHTMGAAGAIEAVVSLAAMAAGVVPPTATDGDADPRCDLALVTGAALHRPNTATLSLSSAFGGSNCALLLEVAP